MCWLFAATPKETPSPASATALPAGFGIKGDGTSSTPICVVKKITNVRELPAQPAKGCATVPCGGRDHSCFSDCWALFDTCPAKLFASGSSRTMFFLPCCMPRCGGTDTHKLSQNCCCQRPELALAKMQRKGKGWEEADGGNSASVKLHHSLTGTPKPAASGSLPAHCCLHLGHGPGPRLLACQQRCPPPRSQRSQR